MWYVIQVMASNENHVKKTIEDRISSDLVSECYVPMRRMKKKFGGHWTIIEEVLFPGYVFIFTSLVEQLFFELRKIDAFTKLLSDEKGQALSLSIEDKKILDCLRGVQISDEGSQKNIVGISSVVIENNEVIIKNGPLKGLEEKIKKFDLHRRFAVVNMEFFGEIREVHLGIDILKRA